MVLTLLIIDRDPLLLQQVARQLRPHRVLQATSGLLGMTVIRSGQHVDGVLASVDLSGMTGMEVLGALHEEYPELAPRFAYLASPTPQLLQDGAPLLGRPPSTEALLRWSEGLSHLTRAPVYSRLTGARP